MNHIETRIQTSDHLSLYVQGWEPPGEVRASVCLVHGLGEHSQRYAHLAQFLTEHGYSLWAFDLRGHGRSEGARGHTPTYDYLLDDIAINLESVRARYPGKRQFLYGHSLGGNLVISYALRRRPSQVSVIATAPLLRLAFDPPVIKVTLGKVMNFLYPAFSQSNGLDRSALSRDPEVVQRYNKDPLVHDRITARLFMGFYQSGLWALDHAAELSLPLLLMQGDMDHLVSVVASQEFAAKAGPNCTLKVWEGFYHEIHNEPEQQQVFQFLVDWMDNRSPAV